MAYEYIGTKEFARRMGETIHTARKRAHSRAMRPFVRQEDTGKTLKINWTLFQQYFENCRL